MFDLYQKKMYLKLEFLKTIEDARNEFDSYDNDEIVLILSELLEEIKQEMEHQELKYSAIKETFNNILKK